MISHRNYLHKPLGKMEGGWGWYGWCSIFVYSGWGTELNVSLSHYKDKYINERRPVNCEMTVPTQADTFDANSCASLARVFFLQCSPTSMFVKCNAVCVSVFVTVCVWTCYLMAAFFHHLCMFVFSLSKQICVHLHWCECKFLGQLSSNSIFCQHAVDVYVSICAHLFTLNNVHSAALIYVLS